MLFRSNSDFLYNTVISLTDTASVLLGKNRLYYYSVSTQKPLPVNSLPSDIKALFKTGNQVYYEDSLNSFFALDINNSRKREQGLIDESGNRFFIQENNSKLFWQPGMESPILMQEGLAWIIKKENNNRLRVRLIASGIPEDALLYFVQYEKEGGYLFLGTASKGIYIIQQNQLTAKQPAERNINSPNSFYSQVELPDGNILTNDGVMIGDAATNRNYNMGNKFMNSVFSINDSVLIYAIKDSVFNYNKKTYRSKLMFKAHINEHFSVAYSEAHLYFVNQDGIEIGRASCRERV